MNTATIRLARDADALPIANLSRCLIELGLRGWTWNPPRVARAIRSRETCVLVAEAGEHVAGFAIAEFGDTRMHLSLLAVSAARQRGGIGSALVHWLEQSALAAGIGEIQLELRANNPGAQYFYQSLGFALAGRVRDYYQGTESAFRMQKAIGTRAASPIKP